MSYSIFSTNSGKIFDFTSILYQNFANFEKYFQNFQVCEVHEKGWKGHKWWRLHEGSYGKDGENEWDQMAKADMVEGPVKEVTCEVMDAMKKMTLGKAAGPSAVNIYMIMASGAGGKFGVGILKKLCQRVLHEKGMPEEQKTSVVVPIFKGKGDVMDCGAYRGVKLLEHAMKIENKRISEGRWHAIWLYAWEGHN